nr:hypothetical protein [Tanacetum cinerariifolium]
MRDFWGSVSYKYKDNEWGKFAHKSAWLFLRDKYKWENPDFTQARRNQGWPIEVDEPELFKDDTISRPFRAPRTSKSQRPSNSFAILGSQKEKFKDLMQQQIALDRAVKMEQMEQETMARVEVSNTQIKNEDLKFIALDSSRMHPADATKVDSKNLLDRFQLACSRY